MNYRRIKEIESKVVHLIDPQGIRLMPGSGVLQ